MEKYIFWLMIATLPFERLLTFEVAGFTVKPAYLLAVFYVAIQIIKYCEKVLFKRDSSTRASLRMTKGVEGQDTVRFENNAGQTWKGIKVEEYIILGFVVWSYLSSLWSLDPKRSIVISTLLLLLVIVFLILRRDITQKLQSQIVNVIIWLGVIVSALAIFQFLLEPVLGYKLVMLREVYSSRVFGFARPQATFLEPLYLANFLIWPLAFALNQRLVPSKPEGLKIKDKKASSCLQLIIMLIAFILTLSRGAYLGLGAGIILILLLGLYLKKIDWISCSKLIGSFVVAVIISLLLVLSVAGWSGVKTFYGHAKSSSDLTPTNQVEELKNRGVSQESAMSQFKKHPVLGIGANAFGALPQFSLLRAQSDWQTVNNEYLEIAAELGIVGLLFLVCFLALLLRFIFGKIKEGNTNYIFYGAAVLALLLQYLTFSTLNLLYIWVFLAVIWPHYEAKGEIMKAKV